MGKEQIDAFFKSKTIAIAGASSNPEKFGNQVYRHLKESGFTLHPVNPKQNEIEGDTCYKNIQDLPDGLESILLATPKEFTNESIKSAIDKGFKNIWIQLSSHNDSTKELIENMDANIIFNKCIFMFADPVKGVHKFHEFCSKLVGKYPK